MPQIGDTVEVKTATGYAREPLPYWLDQMQAIMLCTGSERGWLVWFDSTLDLQYTKIDADHERQAAIVDGAERFMAAIDMGIVPDWVKLDYANQLALHPTAAGKVELDDAGMNWVTALAQARAHRLAAERDEERIKAEVAGLLGDNEVGTFCGAPVVTWKSVKGSMTLDTERLKAEQAPLLESYWVPRAPSRRMNVVLEGAA